MVQKFFWFLFLVDLIELTSVFLSLCMCMFIVRVFYSCMFIVNFFIIVSDLGSMDLCNGGFKLYKEWSIDYVIIWMNFEYMVLKEIIYKRYIWNV